MNDGLSVGMFWAGALMAFTPILLVGGVVLLWWLKRKKDEVPGAGCQVSGNSTPDT